MIAGLSKAITLYLAPVLTLTAVILSILAFLAPTVILHDKVAFLTVLPSTALFNALSPTVTVDGPSIFIGALGSCSRVNKEETINCTAASVVPYYDLTDLPNNAPKLLLSPPSAMTPAFIAVALMLSVFFFITFTLISFRHKMNAKIGASFDRPFVQSLSAWIGVLGFMVGLTAFLILRMVMGKTVTDFNTMLQAQGDSAPRLVASTGNGFTMIWIAYAFFAVPLVTSLTKLNVKNTKA